MKYKIKKRRKAKLIPLLFILSFSFLFMASGYSYFSDTLEINGRANIKIQEVITGESKYECLVSRIWQNGGEEGIMNYTMDINITNNDADIEEWDVNFDVANGIPVSVNCWAASEHIITGNNIHFVCQSWNGSVPLGTVLTLGLNLSVETTEPLKFENFNFNGRTIAGEIIIADNADDSV